MDSGFTDCYGGWWYNFYTRKNTTTARAMEKNIILVAHTSAAYTRVQQKHAMEWMTKENLCKNNNMTTTTASAHHC